MGADGRRRRLTPETWAWLTDSGVRRDESWGKGRSKHSGPGFSPIQHSKADLIKRLYGAKAFCYLVINCAVAQGQHSLVKTDLPQIIRHWRLPIEQIWILRCFFFGYQICCNRMFTSMQCWGSIFKKFSLTSSSQDDSYGESIIVLDALVGTFQLRFSGERRKQKCEERENYCSYYIVSRHNLTTRLQNNLTYLVLTGFIYSPYF